MATRVNAETAAGMLSDIETEPESEHSMYDNSVSSRAMCDDGFENSSNENESVAKTSDESEEEPVDRQRSREREGQGQRHSAS